MIQDWMLYVAAGLLVITWMYLWGARRRIDELECAVSFLKDAVNKLSENQAKYNKGLDGFHKSVEANKGMIHMCSSSLSDRLSRVEKRVGILEKSTVKEEKAEPDEDECDNPPASEVKFWASKSDLADFVDPSNLEKLKPDMSFEWTHEGEIIAYRWTFPSKEQCIPIYGQRYMVVGVLHGHETLKDGSPFICTEEAMWDRYKFVIDSGEKFDKVYAYIKMPDSSDIMKNIMEIALQSKEE